MYISDFMTTKLVTITRDTPIARAARLMYAHKVRRLPVVEDGKLVGIVGDRGVSAALPSAATTLSPKEMSDTLSRVTAAEIMHTEVITVTPETSAESALALAQEKKVGCLVVVDDTKAPIGIVTTNDFIYRLLNPLLGLGKPGVRLHIRNCGDVEQIKRVAEIVEKHGLKLEVIHLDKCPASDQSDLIIQVVTKDPRPLMNDLIRQGYHVEIRKRKSWPIDDDGD